MNAQPQTRILALAAEPYGRVDIRDSSIRNLVLGLVTAIIIHFSALGAYDLAQRLKEADDNIRTVRVRIMKRGEQQWN